MTKLKVEQNWLIFSNIEFPKEFLREITYGSGMFLGVGNIASGLGVTPGDLLSSSSLIWKLVLLKPKFLEFFKFGIFESLLNIFVE